MIQDLYSKHSAQYWGNSFIKGLFTDEMFRYPAAEWLGRITEGKPKYGDTRNPITRVHSSREIKKLFGKFNILSLRKNGFLFSQLPKMSGIRTYLMQNFGHEPSLGGVIVYGAPFITESKIETLLTPYLGWSWNITATKN